MLARTLNLVLTAAFACGGGRDPAPVPAKGAAKTPAAKAAAAEVPAAVEEPRFAAGFEDGACEHLTPATIAEAFGVLAGEVTEMQEGCRYSWGKKSHAHLWWPAVYDDAAIAAQRFESEHQGKSGAQLGKEMKRVTDEVKKQVEDGKIEADAKKAGRVGTGIAGALADGISYEAVEGVGDQAYWRNNVRVMNVRGHEIKAYDNKLDVRVANFSFQIEVHLDEPGPTKDQAIALAKLIVAALP